MSELTSQPGVWNRALRFAAQVTPVLTAPANRTLVAGCGTSAFVAMSLAVLRESAGLGITDAAFPAEASTVREYDQVIVLSRSGTTSEVLALLDLLPSATHRVAITGPRESPLTERVDETIALDFAEDFAVVQTRFPTAVLALARAAFGHPVADLVAHGTQALTWPLPGELDRTAHLVFLGHHWTLGLAHEAALKAREIAQVWSESHPMLDYRHGPVAAAGEHTLVTALGPLPPALGDEITATGARLFEPQLDPLARLVVVQRLAIELAQRKGVDIDRPPHLTRSVVLPDRHAVLVDQHR